MVRFCVSPSSFSILTVDPTFNLGEFDVTLTTYQHQLLISARSGNSPVMIGPVMIHYHKTFHTYLSFAATLIGLRRQLVGLRAFGTDEEKALADEFYLTCFNHCRRNIKAQLQNRNYPEADVKEILDDIFGCQKGSVFCEGLVDSATEGEFSQKLETLDSRWDGIQKASGACTGFFDWFVHNKSSPIVTTMLKSVREEAGLGSPPESFTTNASETVNSITTQSSNHMFRTSQARVD